ncbi:MAG: ATP-binding cassette domain-containing protein, partial [Candidatus Delongbacteria bacterium]|nr:ATP-binding cassette domain-containing protein [Candidatus Delongbacteria bacterium]
MKKGEIIIELKDVQKHYHMGDNVVKAVDGLTISVKQGDFIAVMGPSGSGKSTLMHILGFLDMPTGGKFLFRGDQTMEMDDDALAKIRATRVSFIFQAFNLLPRTTVLQNVLLPLLYHPTIQVRERVSRAETAIESVGLTDRKDFYTNQLSGGQQQRVAIARS